jgi:RimJ/RimL family protein N-acetyltransferase
LQSVLPSPRQAVAAGCSGRISIRTAGERDIDRLSDYFAGLSQSSRYNRFMGTGGSLCRIAKSLLAHDRKADCFTLVAELRNEEQDAIIGEASYGLDRDSRVGEFAISVDDSWQQRGLGSALLCALQCRAVSLGYFRLFGETFRTNDPMRGLARKAGFELARAVDWRTVRFDKALADNVGDA